MWKDTKSILRDKRIRSDKFPLRKSRLLSFLERSRPTFEEGGNLDCLHESQWSCIVTGFNNTVWSVYGFTDTYFYDTDDEFDRVSVNYYQRCLEDEDRMEYDPIIGSDANLPIQDPREYFVATLLSCMNHILEEWNNIITRLERKMCYYVSGSLPNFLRSCKFTLPILFSPPETHAAFRFLRGGCSLVPVLCTRSILRFIID